VLDFGMKKSGEKTQRSFKTKWFAKEAKRALITDSELCEAVREVMKGQADNLGGGVFKKRLNKNMHRSIILAKGGENWIYVFLFAKKDMANIADDDLRRLRDLAEQYEKKSNDDIEKELKIKELVEICNAKETV
jgi:hypothetical protein